MSSQTEKLHLVKPADTEAIDLTVLNGNYDILDEEVDKRLKTVNGIEGDSNGNAQINSVRFAENLESESTQNSTGEFIIRTTGGTASLSDGDAWALRIMGNRVHNGYVAEVIDMTVYPMPREEGDPITATINEATFRAYVATSGTTTLTFSTAWSADPAVYGITVTGTPVAGDVITVVYVKEERGTIVNAAPTTFRSTGFNLYKHSAGYAYVNKYSDTYGFRISGNYTSLAYSATLDGEQTVITPVRGNFTVPGDGYVFVTGGNATNTCIIATWSDWTSGYPGDFQPYTESVIDISTLMSQRFPYGLMMVGTTRDEINLNLQTAYSRIARTTYSASNLATIIAAGYEYEYDTDYIYYVKETAGVYTISIDGDYVASDHGMEFFTGSTIPVYLETIYGTNLKNKLERDVLTISQQTLSKAQQEQVQTNIRALSKLKNTLGTGDDLNSFTSVESNGIYYITTYVGNCPFTWGALLSMMADDTGAQIGIGGGGQIFYRLRSGTPHTWTAWRVVNGTGALANASRIGAIVEGTLTEIVVPSATITNIAQITLGPGNYILTAGFQFQSSFSDMTSGMIYEEDRVYQGSTVRSNTSAGNGYNVSLVIPTSVERTYYLAAYQNSSSSKSVSSRFLRAIRIA